MPGHDPLTSHEEPAINAAKETDDPVQARETPSYERVEDDGWAEDPDELPRRPRRRVLAPLPVTLILVLTIAVGFIAGVLVEKGQASSTTGGGAASGASVASRFAAARGAGTSAGGVAGASAGTGGGAPVSGQVAFVHGSTLYVTNTEGNTIEVTSSAASAVTKTVKSSVRDIHPGEDVVVTGATGKGGTVSAESIRLGTSAGGGGLGSLFGSGGGSSSGRGGAGSGSGSTGSGGSALFGSGG